MGFQVEIADARKIFSKLKIRTKKCSHHVRGFVEIDGIKYFAVHYSHGRKTMPGNVGIKFQKSLRVSVDEFNGLRNCPLSAEEYYELIKERMKNEL